MKVIFCACGAVPDDDLDVYGGWHDVGLLASHKQALKFVRSMHTYISQVDALYYSPQLSAAGLAEYLEDTYKLKGKPWIYLKSRNSYGLLSGVVKEEARKRYPELVEAFYSGQGVLGHEPYAQFLERVGIMLERLKQQPEEKVLCVTHGGIMHALFEDVLEIDVEKIATLSWAEVIYDGSAWELVRYAGIETSNEVG